MLRPFRVSWEFLRIGVMNELQYRANFFVALFQSVLALGVGLVVLSLVFSHTQELKGWTHSELLCVLGIQIAMGGLIRATIQPNMLRVTDEIRDGKLDYALTKPEDSQVLSASARCSCGSSSTSLPERSSSASVSLDSRRA
jgi:ABC-2 type transport system permease protein